MRLWDRKVSVAACALGILACGVAVSIPTHVSATETLTLKKVISINTITSFDISAFDPVTQYYTLGDRTNNGVDVIDTRTNTLLMIAGQGQFTGATPSNNNAGPNGAMIVRGREIWAGDGNSTVKILSLATGAVLAVVSTGGLFRADEMCYDPIHNIGFVANNADSPAFITAISAHRVRGQ
jgi:hypothetical protein